MTATRAFSEARHASRKAEKYEPFLSFGPVRPCRPPCLPGPLAVAIALADAGVRALAVRRALQPLDFQLPHALCRRTSEPFSISAFRAILFIAMVPVSGCVWWFATRANLDSDHDCLWVVLPLRTDTPRWRSSHV